MATQAKMNVTLRLTPALLDRADRLLEALQENPDLLPELTVRNTTTRTAILREALVQGLSGLERKAKREGK